MSRQLLTELNGSKNGALKKFINTFVGEPRIAWYPSAGVDFRALLYLSPQYAASDPVNVEEPQTPDIFLFTDYFPWDKSDFLDSRVIFSDERTEIFVEHIEELPRLNLLPLHPELVNFPNGSRATDRAVFLTIKVVSKTLGTFFYPIIYAFAENETFYCKKMIPFKARISHVIHIRYGGGMGGGGKASGIWIQNVLKPLGSEVFITDNHYGMQSGDEFAFRFCPYIPKHFECELQLLRTIPSEAWSRYGDVSWNLVVC